MQQAAHVRRQRGSSFDVEEQSLSNGQSNAEEPAFSINGRPAAITVTASTMEWSFLDRDGSLTERVVAPHPTPTAYVHSISRPDRGRPCEWHPLTLCVTCDDTKALGSWADDLRHAVAFSAGSARPRRLLVLVNPVSGEGRSAAVVGGILLPALRAAGIGARVCVTRRAAHTAAMLGASEVGELTAYDGIVVVGGDGAFHDLVNALVKGHGADALRALRLAHVPTGSTDAVACSLNGSRSAFCAAAHVALGDSTALDVVRIETSRGSGPPAVTYACCIAAAGFMGQICAVAENYRFLGPLRYDLLGAKTLFLARGVEATVHVASVIEGAVDRTPCVGGCPVCGADWVGCRGAGGRRLEREGTVEWKTFGGRWRSIMLMATPCRSDKTQAGMARFGHLSDGRLTAVLVPEELGPLGMLRTLSHMARYGLAPGELPGVHVLQAAEVTVESADALAWNIDGEPTRAQSLRATVLRGAARAFARGVEARNAGGA